MDLTQSMEDYLETILLLSREEETVRVKDVADRMEVKKPSVVAAVKSLSEKGLVTHERYGSLHLTSEGQSIAEQVYEAHQVLYTFFSRILGLDAKTADHDACMVEHYLSSATRERLILFISLLKEHPEDPRWLTNFHRYVETGEFCQCPECKK